MVCILVGQGYFGKILKSKLENFNLQVITVDPCVETSDFKNYDQIDHTYTTSDTFWFIATPPKTHKNIAIDIITNHGARRIWIEKPLCKTLEDTIELDKFIKRNNVYIYPDFTWLQTNIVKDIVENIKQGCIPKFFKMNISHAPQRSKDVTMLLDLIPHPISILQYMMNTNGGDEIKTISSHYHSEHKIDVIGVTKKNMIFNIELDNTPNISKNRSILFYSDRKTISWPHKDYTPDQPDAIARNITEFFSLSKPPLDFIDIARITEILCKE